MKSYYSSLESIPLNLLGKNHKLSNISLNQSKRIFDEIEKEVFENFINNKSDKVLQEKFLPIIKDIIFEVYKVIRSLIEIKLSTFKSTFKDKPKTFFNKSNESLYLFSANVIST